MSIRMFFVENEIDGLVRPRQKQDGAGLISS
jgi:hypothetical protein